MVIFGKHSRILCLKRKSRFIIELSARTDSCFSAWTFIFREENWGDRTAQDQVKLEAATHMHVLQALELRVAEWQWASLQLSCQISFDSL